MATQNFLAEADGVLGTWGLNNFYLYRLENQPQHVLIAWDADVTFWGPTFPTNEGHNDNVLMNKLMRVQEYRDLYYAELRRAIDLAAEPAGESTWLDDRDSAPAVAHRPGHARRPVQAVPTTASFDAIARPRCRVSRGTGSRSCAASWSGVCGTAARQSFNRPAGGPKALPREGLLQETGVSGSTFCFFAR